MHYQFDKAKLSPESLKNSTFNPALNHITMLEHYSVHLLLAAKNVLFGTFHLNFDQNLYHVIQKYWNMLFVAY